MFIQKVAKPKTVDYRTCHYIAKDGPTYSSVMLFLGFHGNEVKEEVSPVNSI